MKTITWTGKAGNEIKAEVSYSLKLNTETETMYADGYNIPRETTELVDAATVKVYVDGKHYITGGAPCTFGLSVAHKAAGAVANIKQGQKNLGLIASAYTAVQGAVDNERLLALVSADLETLEFIAKLEKANKEADEYEAHVKRVNFAMTLGEGTY